MNRNPTGKGGFQKGQSGNPGGKPKIAAEVRALAQEHSAEAIELLVEIMRDENTAVTSRTAAANAILDRAIGRPEFSGKIDRGCVAVPLAVALGGLDQRFDLVLEEVFATGAWNCYIYDPGALLRSLGKIRHFSYSPL